MTSRALSLLLLSLRATASCAHGQSPASAAYAPSHAAAPFGVPPPGGHGPAPSWTPLAVGSGAPPPAVTLPLAVAPPAPAAPDPATAPATRYADLPGPTCLSELSARGVAWRPATTRRGEVTTPIRFAGLVSGVAVLGLGARAPGSDSVYEILDCRLALAIDDLARVIGPRGVREIRHFSMYRPGARVGKTGKQSQHGRGLAIDVGVLVLESGEKLDLLRDWHGTIGAPVCGPGSEPSESQPAAWNLRHLVCDLYARGIFNLILTPNHDAAHHNHVHLDLEPGKRWIHID